VFRRHNAVYCFLDLVSEAAHIAAMKEHRPHHSRSTSLWMASALLLGALLLALCSPLQARQVVLATTAMGAQAR